ncbi:MAG TPA: hypothetical protein VN829_01275 [Dongiaceae bacterium]|nr:hypothetical protein [Dongiaceae bacterium]
MPEHSWERERQPTQPHLASRQSVAYGSGVNVIALQLDIAWENKPANFAKVRRLLAEAAPPKDSLVVLPEMFATVLNLCRALGHH